ncbi:hypothetical protein [Streptomyces sp. SP18CS02]|uniref:hypothetical protein n=1 Tax=Streptomyces sp. SP18CS02 TaxID=3002531 RepID=UPI002E7911EF|nr:hypothetical protein [Streptomyces sp. SP18CS02]MEE1753812.1 hypothetical protein [Streptomyces sp. SP18CS02]
MPIRQTLAGAALAVTAVLGGVAAPAQAAPAPAATTQAAPTRAVPTQAALAAEAATLASCPSVSGGRGPIIVTSSVIKDRAAVHIGPAGACRTTGYLSVNSSIDLYCTYYNASTGNLWEWTNKGWIWNAYVRDTAYYNC